MAREKPKGRPPVAKIAYRRKGEKNVYIAPVWLREFEGGGFAYNVNPKLEADDYSKVTFQEALKNYAKGDGFINLHVFETMEPTVKPETRDDEDDEFP